MTDLMAARLQMAVSLGFHIIFACVGMVMPFLMMTAHWFWLKRKDPVDYELTRAWSKGVAILFATGAVSGTLLSFELGLLWPTFMEHAGAIIGMPFSLEGTAFFLEAIAIGIFLYGWKKVPPWVHWTSGVVIGVSGLASGFFVVAANAWMNSPAGFDWVDGRAINVDPVEAMFNDAWVSQAIHMSIAAFVSTGFAVAGCHAYLLKKSPNDRLHRRALVIAMWFAAVASLLQPVSGDFSAKDIAHRQPIKLAAAESLFETQTRAPLLIGGIPNVEEERVDYKIEIPGMLSFLAGGDFNAEIKGLNDFPREEWPPVAVVHYAFQLMVGIGMFLAAVSLFFIAGYFFRREWVFHPRFLTVVAWCTPLGFIAIEAGWTVTEVGRQPWIIYGIMKTRDAVSPMPGLIVPFLLITGIYILLSVVVTWLMLRQFRALDQKRHAGAA